MHETLADSQVTFDGPVWGDSLRKIVRDQAALITIWTYRHAGEVTFDFLRDLVGKFLTRYWGTFLSPIQHMDLPFYG